MESAICPHCQAENEAGSTFCAACGKAMPAVMATGPRVVSAAATPTTSAGMKLHTDELHKQAKSASGALLAVAIIQTVFGGIMVAALSASRAGARMDTTILYATVFGVAVIFWALYVWSRWAPLPAAIVGLVVYISLWLLDIIGAIVAMQNPSTPGAVVASPFSGIILRIIIIAVLVKAVKAGVRHRQLTREQTPGFGVV